MSGADLSRIAERYRRFADVEAEGRSPLYAELCRAIARSEGVLSYLATFPAERQQPNLFLAAIRWVAGAPPSAIGALEEIVREHGGAVRETMLTRRTQTNEPARCAVLLPVLARLRQPLALLEIGASAGLCLFPDMYAYEYGRASLRPHDFDAALTPVFHCEANAATPLPSELPRVVWRAGLDLNPLDVRSDADMAWLETLVWPGLEDRAARLRLAIKMAKTQQFRIEAGDLRHDLERLMRAAPANATLVVFHTAVVAYVPDEQERLAFARRMLHSDAVWISNESPQVFPEFARQAPPAPRTDAFLLSVNGRPCAWTGPHGQSIDWFADPT